MYYIRNDSDTICDVLPLSKNDYSKPGLLQGVITNVMTHNTPLIRKLQWNALKI
jgi:hypothetical protein